MRLQVFLAKSGLSSRRNALEFIKQGFVKVNSCIVLEPGTQINPDKDKVEFKGKEIKLKKFVYILLNKPKGIVTTKKDKFADKTLIDLLPGEFHHLNPVGRLDKDTTGLLFLTNDGDLLYRLTHPKFEIKKTYFVRAKGRVVPNDIDLLEKGIVISGRKTYPTQVSSINCKNNYTELNIELKEGRKRQIRMMFDKIKHQVLELKRIREGNLTLGELVPGKWRFLSQKEVQDLYEETGLLR